MNNAWVSLISRAPCAARQTRTQPMLELFNGYARRHNSRWLRTGSREPRIWNGTTSGARDGSDRISRENFSTTALLSARKEASRAATKKKPAPPAAREYKKPPRPVPDIALPVDGPRLGPANTAASHTEGVIDAEVDLENLSWRDYDPDGGMPLPDGELELEQVHSIFGDAEMDADTGNYILSVMHWRRLSGALIDTELKFPTSSRVTREQAALALDYLRHEMPDVDEEANGEVWAEEEGQRLEQELQDRAVDLRLYKPSEADVEDEREQQAQVEPESDQGTAEGRQRNQDSVLLATRRQKEAEYEASQALKQKEAETAELAALHTRRGPLELSGGVQPDTQMILYGPGGISISAPQTKAWLTPVERKPWVKYYEERAQIIKTHTTPQLSTLRRLIPSALFLVGVLAFAAFLAENYTPPPLSARLYPDLPPAVATLAGLTGTLLLFFVLNRVPPLWRTYSKYFTLVPAYPYALSTLGATFRHDTLAHLASNTATLWLMGLLLHQDIGRGAFLAVFLASGATGGFASLAYNVLRQRWAAYIFGCSGAVLGVGAAVCTLRPNGKIVVAGYEVPVAAWVYLALWGGLEVFSAFRMKGLNVDHAGHVGGLLGGFACGMWLRMKARREGEEEVVMRAEEIGTGKEVEVTGVKAF